MNLSGKRVNHRDYGLGTIKELRNMQLEVRFDTGEIKTFRYPLCFEQRLLEYSSSVKTTIYRKYEKTIGNADNWDEESDSQNSARTNFPPKIGGRRYSSDASSLPVSDFHRIYQGALSAEIDFLDDDEHRRTQRLEHGVLIRQYLNRFTYIFESDSELNFPAETEIDIFRGEEKFVGVIISCEDMSVSFSTRKYLGEKCNYVDIASNAVFLLKTLKTRLREIEDHGCSSITKSLICEGRNNICPREDIVKGWKNAKDSATKQPITFIWGPPGTGKTWTLAEIAKDHLKKKSRVLMLSYSNVAVDEAALRIIENSEKSVKPGQVLRYGYPRNKKVQDHPTLSSFNYAVSLNPELTEKIKALQDEKHMPGTSPERKIAIENEINVIRKQIRHCEKQLVNSAAFVATTVSKAVVDRIIYNGNFDLVVFDEASMAYIPQIVFASSLAKKHFVCIGDFKQLPPIIQSKTAAALNNDIFRYCGITEAVENGWGHNWLRMLNIQRRMQSSISDFVSTHMYHGQLIPHESVDMSVHDTVYDLPFRFDAIGLADLSGFMSVCLKSGDKSRFNVLSAFITFGLALQGAMNHEVGIVTPYNAQSRLLRAMVRDAAAQAKSLKQITCSTVHQFQGSEKDIILYDTVDCYRQPYPSNLIRSTKDDYANRLFDVAITRAKGKAIVVSNKDYMQAKSLSK